MAGAELSKAGVEYISSLGMFVGTGGIGASGSAVVAAQGTLDLTAAGTCAVAGVAFGGVAGDAEFAYHRDSGSGILWDKIK